ncbi:hypothetical protein ACKS23_05077 [Histoplasma ohiense]
MLVPPIYPPIHSPFTIPQKKKKKKKNFLGAPRLRAFCHPHCHRADRLADRLAVCFQQHEDCTVVDKILGIVKVDLPWIPRRTRTRYKPFSSPWRKVPEPLFDPRVIST